MTIKKIFISVASADNMLQPMAWLQMVTDFQVLEELSQFGAGLSVHERVDHRVEQRVGEGKPHGHHTEPVVIGHRDDLQMDEEVWYPTDNGRDH